MNFAAVLSQLNDLPRAFKRPGTTFSQFQTSIAYGLVAYTDGTDAIAAQLTSISSAYFGWLDTWGMLFGIVRNTNESDYKYRIRILATLSAFVGTIPGIILWGELILNGTVILTENFPNVGYKLQVPSGISPTQLNQFIQSLGRVRPAGVPFNVVYISGGVYMDSINYFNAPRVTGAYFSDNTTGIGLPIGPLTPNSVPLLPSLFLTDQTLNPSLS